MILLLLLKLEQVLLFIPRFKLVEIYPFLTKDVFQGIFGLEEIKDVLYEALFQPGMKSNDFLNRFPHSVLLYGPCGCGKTMTSESILKSRCFHS
jgi:SpoVK/Ycf46/Vps4 family AAA+-type ATPase